MLHIRKNETLRGAFNDIFDSEITSVGPKRARENVDAKGKERDRERVCVYARVYDRRIERKEKKRVRKCVR